MRLKPAIVLMLCAFAALAACGGTDRQTDETATAGSGTPITVAAAVTRDLEIRETSVGQVEPQVAPLVAAQVAGQITAVNVDVGELVAKGQVLATIDATDFHLARKAAMADIDRLRALIHAQQLKVNRYHELISKNSVNQSTLDDAEAQLAALQAELEAAQVRLQQAQRNIEKATITSPIDGRIDSTQVFEGDYIKTGAPLMRIGDTKHLKVRLPFPETLLSDLRPGLPVRLVSPSSPGNVLDAVISEVRPSITLGSRAAQVIVHVVNPGRWEPGATVTGEVEIGVHKNAILVPEISVVRRPAGTVVYVIDGGRAMERRVSTGLRRDGQVEILSGLEAHEQVAADGAGFLSDAAAVDVKNR